MFAALSCSLLPSPVRSTPFQHFCWKSKLPFVTAMINASLREGWLPSSQKHAIVTPLLKKTGMDADELKNYRPISNLTFMSKLVERAVASRLTSYLYACSDAAATVGVSTSSQHRDIQRQRTVNSSQKDQWWVDRVTSWPDTLKTRITAYELMN